MKPYLVFSKNRYRVGWEMDEYRTAEEAATRALGREDGEEVIVARRLTLKVSLEDAPELEPEVKPCPITEAVGSEMDTPDFGKLGVTEKVEESF